MQTILMYSTTEKSEPEQKTQVSRSARVLSSMKPKDRNIGCSRDLTRTKSSLYLDLVICHVGWYMVHRPAYPISARHCASIVWMCKVELFFVDWIWLGGLPIENLWCTVTYYLLNLQTLALRVTYLHCCVVGWYFPVALIDRWADRTVSTHSNSWPKEVSYLNYSHLICITNNIVYWMCLIQSWPTKEFLIMISV